LTKYYVFYYFKKELIKCYQNKRRKALPKQKEKGITKTKGERHYQNKRRGPRGTMGSP
jgi:hypothetical protein